MWVTFYFPLFSLFYFYFFFCHARSFFLPPRDNRNTVKRTRARVIHAAGLTCILPTHRPLSVLTSYILYAFYTSGWNTSHVYLYIYDIILYNIMRNIRVPIYMYCIHILDRIFIQGDSPKYILVPLFSFNNTFIQILIFGTLENT